MRLHSGRLCKIFAEAKFVFFAEADIASRAIQQLVLQSAVLLPLHTQGRKRSSNIQQFRRRSFVIQETM